MKNWIHNSNSKYIADREFIFNTDCIGMTKFNKYVLQFSTAT